MRSLIIATGLVAVLWGAVFALLFAPLPAIAEQPQAPAYAPRNLREQFALDLLAGLGNTQPSAATVGFVVSWTLAEDGGDGALARNNPLNTTQGSGAETMVINSDGVRGYASYEDGLAATLRTITNGLYDPLVAALQTNDAEGALQALIASPWASSHYGGGAGWPRVEIGPSGALDPRRQRIIELALSQMGKPYVLGTDGPDTFDCSGLVYWVYGQIGIETTRTTFTQLDALPAVDPSELQPGDLIFQQFPSDQHVVIFAGDLDGDGRADAIEAGGYLSGPQNVNVLSDFFGSHPTFTSAIIGYRRAL